MLEPEIKIHSWSRSCDAETLVHFQIILLDGSFVLWVGCGEPSLENLALALQSRIDNTPSVTLLTGRSEAAQNFAKKLVHFTKQMVFLSFNLDDVPPSVQAMVEKEVLTTWTALRTQERNASTKRQIVEDVKTAEADQKDGTNQRTEQTDRTDVMEKLKEKTEKTTGLGAELESGTTNLKKKKNRKSRKKVK
eukprot:gb/GEZN01019296.1/.p1 GENE.gb/GEZN01019296.1/~~gb/GEZN01019296.1/.p1  ORF type:complete len:192 (-),score=43.83 gb/GEZN01019296.1/:87-662(-)